MHICFLTNEYPKEGFPHGGLGTFVKTIAEELVSKNIQVSVVGLNYNPIDETEQLNGVTVIRIKRSKVKGLAWFFNSKNIGKTIVLAPLALTFDVITAPIAGAFLLTCAMSRSPCFSLKI